jgi:DNA polymerase-1
MPDDLRVQIEPLHQLVKAMGLPLLMESGVEADDVMGTLACRAQACGHQVIIVTGDKDMAQLVNADIILENTMSNTRMDIQGVVDKFGVRPEQIIDYLALMGDSVDNIPGVPKVGPKTAAKWLEQYGTLENLISHAAEIKGKIGENLRNALAQLPLAKQLTTIRCDLELPFGVDDLKAQPIDKAALRALLTELGFLSWLKTLDNTATDTPATPEPEPETAPALYETIFTETQLDDWLKRLEAADLFAFDTETTFSAQLPGSPCPARPHRNAGKTPPAVRKP